MSESKRRKVTLACSECRERKRKCDGERPRCGNCAKRKPPPACIYTDENLKRGSSSYVDSLRTRIKELEDHLVRIQHPATPISPAVFDALQSSPTKQEIGGLASTEQPSIGSNREQKTATLPKHDDFDRHSASSPTQDDENVIHGIGVMGTPGGNVCSHCHGLRAEKNEYAGQSAAANFDYQIRQWTQSSAKDQGIVEPTTQKIPKMCHCWAGRSLNISHAVRDWIVPPRAEADALVNSYFERVYSLYPFLIRQIFMQTYTQLWHPEPGRHGSPSSDAETDGFYGLLNSVFALGAQYAEYLEPVRRVSSSAVFYNRAINTLKIHLLEQGNIELVQSLLLSSQYLQSTHSWEMCWNLVGLAVRVAQGIGLHVRPPESLEKNRPPSFALEEAMRRRAWAGCVTLDRVLALLYGKPQMLHPSLTRTFTSNLPELSDEELACGTNATKGQEPRNIDFFVESLHLIHYLGQILDLHSARDISGKTSNVPGQAVGDNPPTVDPEHLQKMLNLDATLVAWKHRLPQHLQTRTSGKSPLFVRQAQVLRARYLHMRVFLLRPVLLALHKHSIDQESSAENEAAEHRVELNALIGCAKTCLEVNMAVVDVVYNDVHSGKAPSIVWWYGLYYIHFCAMVIHAGRLCAHLPGLNIGTELQQSFHKCLLCLQKYEAFGIAAKKCRTALEMLERQAFPVQPPPPIPDNSDWTTSSAYIPQSTLYDAPFQYSIPTELSSMYDNSGAGGYFFTPDADNFFWTTFLPTGGGFSH